MNENKRVIVWHTATAIPFMIPFLGIAGLSPNFHIHVSVSDLYIPRIGPHISSRRKGRPIVGIYNSLTDTWMWKLELRPRYSFSGNICFKFSALCLCSARSIPVWPWGGWEGRRRQGRGTRWPACRAAGQDAGSWYSRTAPAESYRWMTSYSRRLVSVSGCQCQSPGFDPSILRLSGESEGRQMRQCLITYIKKFPLEVSEKNNHCFYKYWSSPESLAAG